MKKRLLILAVMAISLLSAQAQEKTPLRLSGTVVGVTNGKVYLQKFIDKYYVVIDSAKIQNGQFSFSTKTELPEIYGLSSNSKENPYLLFLDKNQITVKLDPADYDRTVVKGSALHALYTDYMNQKEVKIDQFIKQHPSSLVSAYALYRHFAYRLTPAEIEANIKLLDPSLHKTTYVQVLKKLVATLNNVSIGKKAPGFSGTTPDGKTVGLSDRLGKGYLLIDFWASWCTPCRKENPGIVKVYQKYKDKGFDILAISLDKSKEQWVKAIADDHLEWTQISELKQWQNEVLNKYGVRSIPANFLVDSKGVIVAKNVFGEDLEKILNELLNK
ncbi:TlpA disulfide reductase family protein [Bacteroides sedimenti]|uniref:Thiol:disulfide interchange protein n=1 Tax=Bacteroides sedimenti TaxID=2136147 RepID=A0ABM8IAH1_9BACE